MKRLVLGCGAVLAGLGLATLGAGCGDPSVKTQDIKPPPLSGGSLHVTSGGLVVASDPDRDVIWLVKPNSHVVAQIDLEQGDEPGRIAESADGRIHVALRSGGAIVSFWPPADLSAKDEHVLVDRRAVCGGPRGIAYDAASDSLHVACVRGEFVTLGLGDGSERRLQLDEDLRDVVVEGNIVYVSRFRAAEVLVLDQDGLVIDRKVPDAVVSGGSPSVAWKMIKNMGGPGVVVSHQEANIPESELAGQGSNKYYGPQLLGSVVSVLSYEGGQLSANPNFYPSMSGTVLPVDVAMSPTGGWAVAGAGASELVQGYGSDCQYGCSLGNGTPVTLPGRPIAVAYDAQGNLVFQTREPATVAGVSISVESRYDEGHEMFHDAPFGLACASCHPEGRDDGLTWRFNSKSRRTMSLTGDVTQATPFHWEGDLAGMGDFMTEVFVTRMGGDQPTGSQVDAMSSFLASGLRRLPVRADLDPEAVSRGQILFNDGEVGCSGCHSGPQLTKLSMEDVGTGSEFKVPRLVDLASHGPFMHDGCAATIEDRFVGSCGGSNHGDVSGLTDLQLADLVTYLKSL